MVPTQHLAQYQPLFAGEETELAGAALAWLALDAEPAQLPRNSRLSSGSAANIRAWHASPAPPPVSLSPQKPTQHAGTLEQLLAEQSAALKECLHLHHRITAVVSSGRGPKWEAPRHRSLRQAIGGTPGSRAASHEEALPHHASASRRSAEAQQMRLQTAPAVDLPESIEASPRAVAVSPESIEASPFLEETSQPECKVARFREGSDLHSERLFGYSDLSDLTGGERSSQLPSKRNEVSRPRASTVRLLRRSTTNVSQRGTERRGWDGMLSRVSTLRRRSTLREHSDAYKHELSMDVHSGHNLKREILERIVNNRPDNDMEDWYHENGHYFADIARTSWFKSLSVSMVVANLIWIGIDMEFNRHDIPEQSPISYRVMSNVFCLFFTIELAVRFRACREPVQAFRDWHFTLDSVLVVCMVFETWVEEFLFVVLGGAMPGNRSLNLGWMRFLRFLRVSRVARAARLMRTVPELTILFKGMTTAIRSVFGTLLLLMLVVYMFSIIFFQLLSPNGNEGHFHHISSTMHYLLLMGVFPDQFAFMNRLLREGLGFYLLGLLYLLIASLTILNMLVGVLVGVIQVVSDVQHYETMVHGVKDLVTQTIHNLDIQGAAITREDFEKIVYETDLMHELYYAGAMVPDIVDNVYEAFEDAEETRDARQVGGVTIVFEDFLKIIFDNLGSQGEARQALARHNEIQKMLREASNPHHPDDWRGKARERISTEETRYYGSQQLAGKITSRAVSSQSSRSARDILTSPRGRLSRGGD